MEQYMLKIKDQESWWRTSKNTTSTYILQIDDCKISIGHVKGPKCDFWDMCNVLVYLFREEINTYLNEYKRINEFGMRYYRTDDTSSPRYEVKIFLMEGIVKKSFVGGLEMSCHYKVEDFQNIWIGDFVELLIEAIYQFDKYNRFNTEEAYRWLKMILNDDNNFRVKNKLVDARKIKHIIENKGRRSQFFDL